MEQYLNSQKRRQETRLSCVHLHSHRPKFQKPNFRLERVISWVELVKIITIISRRVHNWPMLCPFELLLWPYLLIHLKIKSASSRQHIPVTGTHEQELLITKVKTDTGTSSCDLTNSYYWPSFIYIVPNILFNFIRFFFLCSNKINSQSTKDILDCEYWQFVHLCTCAEFWEIKKTWIPAPQKQTGIDSCSLHMLELVQVWPRFNSSILIC